MPASKPAQGPAVSPTNPQRRSLTGEDQVSDFEDTSSPIRANATSRGRQSLIPLGVLWYKILGIVFDHSTCLPSPFDSRAIEDQRGRNARSLTGGASILLTENTFQNHVQEELHALMDIESIEKDWRVEFAEAIRTFITRLQQQQKNCEPSLQGTKRQEGTGQGMPLSCPVAQFALPIPLPQGSEHQDGTSPDSLITSSVKASLESKAKPPVLAIRRVISTDPS